MLTRGVGEVKGLAVLTRELRPRRAKAFVTTRQGLLVSCVSGEGRDSGDFRVAADDARLAANFTRLGIHHGSGPTETLPHLVGIQRAARLIYTREQVSGARAAEIGLYDEAPLAVRSVRATLRRELLAALPAAMDHENGEQIRMSRTPDARAGIRAAVSGASR